jgi:hypothetical protein
MKTIAKLIFRLYFGKSVDTVDPLEFIDKHLKRKGYDKYGNIYTKGFVVIDLKFKSKELSQIEIFIDQTSRSRLIIDENFITSLIISENYFSRI